MRQVGRSVQCRQNRRGRTAATWPYSVRIKGSRNFPTSGPRCGGRDGGARENSGLARTGSHGRTLRVDSPAALAEAGRRPRCHCGGGPRILFCGDLRSQLSNPSGDRDPPGGQPIRRMVRSPVAVRQSEGTIMRTTRLDGGGGPGASARTTWERVLLSRQADRWMEISAGTRLMGR